MTGRRKRAFFRNRGRPPAISRHDALPFPSLASILAASFWPMRVLRRRWF